MAANDLYFVIPTYRLREVGETVEHYDEHFWRNGHSVKMLVFDDSSPANQEKYYSLLEQTRTHNELYYVGPHEKEQFLGHLNQRLRDKRLDGLVKNLFRPSYGGNRNFTLMYTLGGLMVSVDDDMRPYSLMEHSPESLESEDGTRTGHMTKRHALRTEHRRHVSDLEAGKPSGETGPHHILAASSPADEQTRVLKHGDTFAVFDRHGDIRPGGLGEEGLYHEGTRFLSCLMVTRAGGGSK